MTNCHMRTWCMSHFKCQRQCTIVFTAPPTVLPFPLFDNFVTRHQVVATLYYHNLVSFLQNGWDNLPFESAIFSQLMRFLHHATQPRVSPSRLCMQPGHWRVHSAESSKFLYLIKQVQSHRDAGERCVIAAYNQHLLDLVQVGIHTQHVFLTSSAYPPCVSMVAYQHTYRFQETLSAHWIGYVRPDSTEAALDIDLFNRSKVYSAVLVSAELQNLDMPVILINSLRCSHCTTDCCFTCPCVADSRCSQHICARRRCRRRR